ncbi:hypothetical protein JW887_06585 [Candidatus Dojkabacteria bacterium]|nr:hypothetical protein [Candidatus Dojkabacteria bacterium]
MIPLPDSGTVHDSCSFYDKYSPELYLGPDINLVKYDKTERAGLGSGSFILAQPPFNLVWKECTAPESPVMQTITQYFCEDLLYKKAQRFRSGPRQHKSVFSFPLSTELASTQISDQPDSWMFRFSREQVFQTRVLFYLAEAIESFEYQALENLAREALCSWNIINRTDEFILPQVLEYLSDMLLFSARLQLEKSYLGCSDFKSFMDERSAMIASKFENVWTSVKSPILANVRRRIFFGTRIPDEMENLIYHIARLYYVPLVTKEPLSLFYISEFSSMGTTTKKMNTEGTVKDLMSIPTFYHWLKYTLGFESMTLEKLDKELRNQMANWKQGGVGKWLGLRDSPDDGSSEVRDPFPGRGKVRWKFERRDRANERQ